jgi:AcrR family transcriptional regulator
MAHPRLNDAELIGRIAEVFRERGYEGSSLSELAAAVGLEKGSLYHRFPGGKDEMVEAVISMVDNYFGENVFPVLRGNGTAQERAAKAARLLCEFYGAGTKACTLDTLSLPTSNKSLQKSIRGSAQSLMNSFKRLAEECQVTHGEAARRAQNAIVTLEGSLIYARVLGDTGPFLRFIDDLPNMLTRKAAVVSRKRR